MRTVVIGAYGYTGRLICQEFKKHNTTFSIAGRDEEKLKRLQRDLDLQHPFHVCDLRNRTESDQLIHQFDLFVNCAGPFTEESSEFTELIAQSGKKYLDITGEVGFIKNSKERNDQTAISSGSLLVHGVAFESMLVDLALQLFSTENEHADLEIFYRFNQNKVSPGTRITLKLAKFRQNWRIKDGTWKEYDFQQKQPFLKFEDSVFSTFPYPLPEITFAHWNYRSENVNSYLLLPENEAKYIPTVQRRESEISRTLENLKLVKKEGPSEEERAAQVCLIFIRSDNKFWLLESRNMYQITAECLRIAVKKIAGSPNTFFGVISPAQLFRNEEKRVFDELKVRLVELSPEEINVLR